MVRKKRKKKSRTKRKPKKEPKESVHVRLGRPVASRKAILQETLNIVDLLKRYERVANLRDEKEDLIERFRTELREIKKLLNMVRLKELPMVMDELNEVKTVRGRKVFMPKEEIKKKKISKVKKVKKPPVVKVSPVDPLDAQMAELRKKMSQL